MPLTDIQRNVARVLRPFRNPENYVAGGAALNLDGPRQSDDLDIFLDRRNRLPDVVYPEIEALRHDGFEVHTEFEDVGTVEVIARKFNFDTRIQWMDDAETSRRFLPAIADEELGYRLHKADNAVNKVLAASRRNTAPRDAVDLVTIVRHYCPLGPLAWAAAAKKEDTNALAILRGVRRNALGYSSREIETVRIENEPPVTREELRKALIPALESAAVYCEDRTPENHVGCLFIDDNETPVEADDDMIASGATRALRIRDFGITVAIDNDDNEQAGKVPE